MLNLINHPLLAHKLTCLRRRETPTSLFRETLAEIAALMVYEITKDLPVRQVIAETPLGPCKSLELATDVVLIPVLRAGLGMVEGIIRLIPSATTGHIGIYRNDDTLQPMAYYSKFPENLHDAVIMILDPMLATGGSSSAAIGMLKSRGARNIRLISVIGAPEGVERLKKEHPDVIIYLAGLDDKLNDNGYIIPGLGDAGDRLFGTK
jgi:uracil phosphoribosyltransferase